MDRINKKRAAMLRKHLDVIAEDMDGWAEILRSELAQMRNSLASSSGLTIDKLANIYGELYQHGHGVMSALGDRIIDMERFRKKINKVWKHIESR